MGLSTIDPYPMPQEHELPEEVVAWRPRRQRTVLLIHDMQRYFLAPFTAGVAPVAELVDNIARIRDRCAQLGIPVTYTAQPGDMTEQQRGLLKDFWGPGMSVSPEHRRIIDRLRPHEGDQVFTKWRYSALLRTGLLEAVRAEGRDQLIVCGVYAHVGCLVTACDAFSHDIQPFMVADAVADFSRDYHRMALRYAAQRCAAVPTTARLLDWLDGDDEVTTAGAATLVGETSR